MIAEERFSSRLYGSKAAPAGDEPWRKEALAQGRQKNSEFEEIYQAQRKEELSERMKVSTMWDGTSEVKRAAPSRELAASWRMIGHSLGSGPLGRGLNQLLRTKMSRHLGEEPATGQLGGGLRNLVRLASARRNTAVQDKKSDTSDAALSPTVALQSAAAGATIDANAGGSKDDSNRDDNASNGKTAASAAPASKNIQAGAGTGAAPRSDSGKTVAAAVPSSSLSS